MFARSADSATTPAAISGNRLNISCWIAARSVSTSPRKPSPRPTVASTLRASACRSSAANAFARSSAICGTEGTSSGAGGTRGGYRQPSRLIRQPDRDKLSPGAGHVQHPCGACKQGDQQHPGDQAKSVTAVGCRHRAATRPGARRRAGAQPPPPGRRRRPIRGARRDPAPPTLRRARRHARLRSSATPALQSRHRSRRPRHWRAATLQLPGLVRRPPHAPGLCMPWPARGCDQGPAPVSRCRWRAPTVPRQ